MEKTQGPPSWLVAAASWSIPLRIIRDERSAYLKARSGRSFAAGLGMHEATWFSMKDSTADILKLINSSISNITANDLDLEQLEIQTNFFQVFS